MRHDTLGTDYKNKVEEDMVEMITNKKLAPSAIKKKIHMDLCDRLERRWK